MRTIEVVDYDPSWPAYFIAECGVLQRVLTGVAVAIHHMGSTAVHGLAAKPVIDILVEVTSLEALDVHNGDMKNIGYKPKGEFGIAGRRYFQKGGDKRTHQIHAFIACDRHVTRHIAFRDYLRANQDVADAYGRLKRRIAQSCDDDIEKYCNGKENFIKQYETLAVKQYLRLHGPLSRGITDP